MRLHAPAILLMVTIMGVTLIVAGAYLALVIATLLESSQL